MCAVSATGTDSPTPGAHVNTRSLYARAQHSHGARPAHVARRVLHSRACTLAHARRAPQASLAGVHDACRRIHTLCACMSALARARLCHQRVRGNEQRWSVPSRSASAECPHSRRGSHTELAAACVHNVLRESVERPAHGQRHVDRHRRRLRRSELRKLRDMRKRTSGRSRMKPCASMMPAGPMCAPGMTRISHAPPICDTTRP